MQVLAYLTGILLRIVETQNKILSSVMNNLNSVTRNFIKLNYLSFPLCVGEYKSFLLGATCILLHRSK